MDKAIVEKLTAAGVDLSFATNVLSVPIQVNDGREPIPLKGEISVMSGDIVLPAVQLKRVSELYAGHGQAPSFKNGPTSEYMWFFVLIERTAIDFCSCTGRIERDVEFERLYSQLRRRPDGVDANPLFSYIQAAARLYMSIREVSRAEFEAVSSRLAISARIFSMGSTSRNYFDVVFKSVGIG